MPWIRATLAEVSTPGAGIVLCRTQYPALMRSQSVRWHLAADSTHGKEWRNAHDICQRAEGNKEHDWIHALVHLIEGDHANAAYWYTGKNEGNWITSSYYMEELPRWVQKFNESDKVEAYLKPWNTLYDIDGYIESGDKNWKAKQYK